MKKTLSVLFISIFAITILFSSCKKNSNTQPAPTSCNISTTTSDFQTIFGTGVLRTWDFEVHSYNFKVASNKTICKIGYESDPNVGSSPYTIRIKDGTTTIYSSPHVFTVGATSYVTPTSTINLIAGKTYTIERAHTHVPGSAQYSIGRVKVMSFPVTSGDMTITGVNFYCADFHINGPYPSSNDRIPFIDIIFQQ